MNSGTLSTIQRAIATLGVTFCGLTSAYPQASKIQHVHLSLVSEHGSVASGGSQWVGLRFQLDPGWHIYWSNPGDSGEPPKVVWQLPSGFKTGDLQFPTPHRIADHGLTDYGYEGDVVLLSKLTAPSGAASKTEIGADVRYLVCREVCMPGKDHVSLSLAGGEDEKSSSQAELIRGAQANLPQSLPPGARVSADLVPDAVLITVRGQNTVMGEIRDFIPSDAQVIDNSTRPMISASGAVWKIRIKKSEQPNNPSITRLRGLLITSTKAYNVDVPVTPVKKTSQSASVPKHS